MKVLDVCEFQKGFFEKIRTGEIPCDGIIARISKRSGSIDGALIDAANLAHEIGVPFGVYKYTYAENYDQGKAEARNITRILDYHDIETPLGIWLDMETDILRRDPVKTQRVYDGFKEGLKPYVLEGVYCDNDFYKANVSVFGTCKLWIARWGSKEPTMWSGDRTVGWQYTNNFLGYNLDCSEWKCDVEPKNENTVRYNPQNVKILQEYLNKNYNYSLKTDGVMGTKTFTAICQTIAK